MTWEVEFAWNVAQRFLMKNVLIVILIKNDHRIKNFLTVRCFEVFVNVDEIFEMDKRA